MTEHYKTFLTLKLKLSSMPFILIAGDMSTVNSKWLSDSSRGSCGAVMQNNKIRITKFYFLCLLR